MKRAFLQISVITVLLLAVAITASAWFFLVSEISDDINGSALTGYFNGGDGSERTPYEIDNPTQLYNLAWLQYIGYLNDETEDSISQYYFKLTNNLDMTGVILPPIGTAEYPFVGNFNGQGFCISNLTVSNYLDIGAAETEFGIVTRPLSVITINGEDGKNVSVTGFFGIVGATSPEMSKKLADTPTNRVNAVYDLFLENITIRTETNESLIGLLAGYVNASVENVGIHKGTIAIGDGTNPITDSPFEMGAVISAYSLIGKYNGENVLWEGLPGFGDGNEGSGDTEGDDAGWGGSINFLELRKRIAYIIGAVGVTEVPGQNLGNDHYEITAFGYHGRFSSNQPYTINGYTNRTHRAVFLKNTVMPLSIDPTALENPATNVFGNYDFNTTEYYKNNVELNAEPVLSTNSAYIVGGGTAYDDAYVNLKPERPFGYKSGTSAMASVSGAGIFKSLGTEINKDLLFPSDSQNAVFHMLTVTKDGDTKLILDEYNTDGFNTASPTNKEGTYLATAYSGKGAAYTALGFTKYIVNYDSVTKTDSGVRTAFMNNNKGSDILQGISFKGKIDLSNLQTTKADVMLINNPYSQYELIDGAINFTLKEAGTLTTIAGTYERCGQTQQNVNQDFSGSSIVHTLFRIIKVERDPDTNKIDNCYLINTIYKVVDANNNEFVEYAYNEDVEDGQIIDGRKYILVYNYSAMSSLTEVGAAYYFEIPLNAGEYAIGLTTEDSSKSGAVLLYLDIGANGSEDSSGAGPGGETTDTVHGIQNVTFVDAAAIANKSTEGYKNVIFSVATNDTPSSHGGLHLIFERTKSQETDKVTCTATGDVEAFDIKAGKEDDGTDAEIDTG